MTWVLPSKGSLNVFQHYFTCFFRGRKYKVKGRWNGGISWDFFSNISCPHCRRSKVCFLCIFIRICNTTFHSQTVFGLFKKRGRKKKESGSSSELTSEYSLEHWPCFLISKFQVKLQLGQVLSLKIRSFHHRAFHKKSDHFCGFYLFSSSFFFWARLLHQRIQRKTWHLWLLLPAC